MFNFLKNKKIAGFTLLETLVTIVVISIGIMGSINLLNNSFQLATIAKNRLIAADLSQEGFELVRNVRDSNYLKNDPWLKNLSNCVNPNWCLIDTPSGLGTPLPSIQSMDLNQGQICFNSGRGYYSISCSINSGEAVNFRRAIQITEIGNGSRGIKIISRVSWKEKGQWTDFGSNGKNFEYHLCDWKTSDQYATCY